MVPSKVALSAASYHYQCVEDLLRTIDPNTQKGIVKRSRKERVSAKAASACRTGFQGRNPELIRTWKKEVAGTAASATFGGNRTKKLVHVSAFGCASHPMRVCVVANPTPESWLCPEAGAGEETKRAACVPI